MPVLFDPVGAGATSYRTEVARHIPAEIDLAIIRGNAAEIANVINEKWEIKGVDAGTGNGNVVSIARQAADELNTVAVITGKKMLLQMRENYCYSKWSPYFNESYGNRLFTNFCNRSICSSGKDYVSGSSRINVLWCSFGTGNC